MTTTQTQVRERGRLLEATSTTTGGTTRRIQIITPGWGSSGYYSPDVLERAAENRVIPAGTHMYFDHASDSERTDRPERSVRDIAAVLTEDATWDGTGLFANADILGPHAELIEALAPYIGVSISGSATDTSIGEAEGRTGPIIEDLAHVASVDFVTRAGRGGAVLLESARPSLVNARAAAHGVDEATVNDIRTQLQSLLREAHGAERTYVWVRDFDESTVWFEVESEDESGIWAQAYTSSGDVVALTGDRTEVRVVTTYVPVARPGSTTTTQESKEDTMPQIEEAQLRQLEADAGRVPTLESERDTAVSERDALRDQLAAERRTNRARTLIGERAREAQVTFTPLEERGLMVDLPTSEDGTLDEAAFTTAVDEATAAIAQARGAGTVSGFGGTATSQTTDITEADLDAAVGSVFGRQVKEA